MLLARAGLAPPGPGAAAVRTGAWAFTGLFALSTLGNLASRSRGERLVMAPLAAAIALSFAVVAAV